MFVNKRGGLESHALGNTTENRIGPDYAEIYDLFLAVRDQLRDSEVFGLREVVMELFTPPYLISFHTLQLKFQKQGNVEMGDLAWLHNQIKSHIVPMIRATIQQYGFGLENVKGIGYVLTDNTGMWVNSNPDLDLNTDLKSALRTNIISLVRCWEEIELEQFGSLSNVQFFYLESDSLVIPNLSKTSAETPIVVKFKRKESVALLNPAELMLLNLLISKGGYIDEKMWNQAGLLEVSDFWHLIYSLDNELQATGLFAGPMLYVQNGSLGISFGKKDKRLSVSRLFSVTKNQVEGYLVSGSWHLGDYLFQIFEPDAEFEGVPDLSPRLTSSGGQYRLLRIIDADGSRQQLIEVGPEQLGLLEYLIKNKATELDLTAHITQYINESGKPVRTLQDRWGKLRQTLAAIGVSLDSLGISIKTEMLVIEA